MIPVKELRIGNNVFGAAPDSLVTIDAEKLVTLERMPHLVIPISLTPEILIACGFVNIRDVYWCIPSNEPSKSFEICRWSDHISYTMANHFHLTINSLHQLQNLYFALTGKELEYKPK